MADVGKFFGSLFGSAAAGVASPAASVVDGAARIIGMFKMDPTLKAQLQAQLVAENVDLEKAELAAQVAAMQGQLDIDKAEASSTSRFIAGWRPFIGWVCGFSLAWEFVLKPFLAFTLIATHHPPIVPLPVLDVASLISGLLVPMLGLGGLRSLEKIQGAAGADKLN